MELTDKQEKLKQRINIHLRNMTRQLIKFDTVQEALNYLLEAFYREFTCDLVGVILNEDQKLIPKVWIGDGFDIETTLKLDLQSCSPNLLEDALRWPNEKEEGVECKFRQALENEQLSTWFTVPLKHNNNNNSFGLCLIGFRNFVPLVLEAEKIFVEFGHDVAIAIDLARDKEKQKRKIKGIEWIRENIYPGSSIEQVIEKIVERAGKGTQSDGANIYLFDEKHSCFIYHPPSYGMNLLPDKVYVETNQPIQNYFPSVERVGGTELTVPLIVNLKTIGALHVCKKNRKVFTEEDLEFLRFVSAYVSMQIENARLYKFEYESKKRLERLMEHHQELVRKTVEGEDLNTISKTISSMVESSIILYDRFLKPISSYFKEDETHLYTKIETIITNNRQKITQIKSSEIWLEDDQEVSCVVWPIVGGREVLGYLVVCMSDRKLDRVLRLTLDHAKNVYAIEFIKQKLVLDTTELVKESFVNQLFSERISDQEKIIQYATLFNWNVLDSHRIATLSLQIDQDSIEESNVVVIEGYRTWLWEQIKTNVLLFDSKMVFSRKGEEFIFIVNEAGEKKRASDYWRTLFKSINDLLKKESSLTKIYIGIGGKTSKIEDYYACYLQSVKAKNVVLHRYPKGGYAFYDDLGSYTILNNTSDPLAAELFVKKNLAPLLKYSGSNNVDLFFTLQVFLNCNGNFRDASKQLYIHRSTLEYRLERVAELLQVDLNDAEVRFELMMAYKLYRLFNFSSEQLV